MTLPPCPLCAKPIHDQAYVCWPCTEDARSHLARAGSLAGEPEVTIARLDRLVRVASDRRPDPEPEPPLRPGQTPPEAALTATPWVFSPTARRLYDAAYSDLTTWLRHCLDERGQPHPVVRSQPCRHRSCWLISQGRPLGPRCDAWPLEHPLEVTTRELARQLGWLRQREEAPEALPVIVSSCQRIERVVDRPAERVIAGRCECGTYLYARAGAATVRCTGCGTGYDVASSRDALRASLADSLFTPAEIATLAQVLGYEGKRDALRNRINQWAGRGLIAAHGDFEGQPAYRFGEVMARVLAIAR